MRRPDLSKRAKAGIAGPRPMLQPWFCDQCHSRGLVECLSSDDVLACALEIAMLHATASPYCHEEFGARFVRCGEWREAEV